MKYFPLKRSIINFRRINIISKSKQCTKDVSRKVKAREETNIPKIVVHLIFSASQYFCCNHKNNLKDIACCSVFSEAKSSYQH